MSDASPYGVTQNADAAQVTADALVGERAGSIRENAVFGSPATMSTAPYKPPVVNGRLRTRIGFCTGKDDTCMAYVIRGTDLCIFHTRPTTVPAPPAEP